MTDAGPADDQEALERLARGDLVALEALYDRYAAPVYHLLLSQTADSDVAQDLLQEVFLALVARGAGASRIRSVRAWLLTVAHRLVMRRWQRGRGREQPLANPLPAEELNLEQHLDVRRAVMALPPEQAAVVALKIWHDLDFAEIARALRISPNTAASRYRYALAKLRVLLRDEDHA